MIAGDWYKISNLAEYDTPLMAVYPDRIKTNIALALQMLNGDVSRLMPHIKTHKTAEVLRMFRDQGIRQVKCATIAEAELAAQQGIADVFLAYQPSGKKIARLAGLVKAYPQVHFYCLVDNLPSAVQIGSQMLSLTGRPLGIYLDLNTGMDRTGYSHLNAVPDFYLRLSRVPGIDLKGLHIYDGHIHGTDLSSRFAAVEKVFSQVLADVATITWAGLPRPVIVAGGSNTFAFYAQQEEVICSPGTFVFWDQNYSLKLPELKFLPAAVLVTTVISKPAAGLLCLDLGYKSVSSENPIDKRVFFPWNPDLSTVSHSEEHLTVRSSIADQYEVGTLVYGLPHHVCPAVALYDELLEVKDNLITGQWEVAARGRKLCL
ncbi:MAG: D-TA family PLP-dependent enzyme [Bacteroidota bacterium]